MNIAFFTIAETSPLIGGIEKVTHNLTHLFKNNGIGVYSFCMQGTGNATRFILPHTNNRQTVCNFIDQKVKEHHIDIIIDQYGIGNYMSHDNLRSEVKIIRCIHYNIIENHISASLLKNLSLSRLKYSMMNVLFWLNTPWRRYKEQRNLTAYAKGTDKVVFLSASYFDCFPDQRYRDKLHAIPNIVSIPPVSEVTGGGKENILLFCGRIVHNPKNIIYLLQLWNRLYKDYPTWKMVMCGDGDDRKMAEEYIRKHKLQRIAITGFTDPNPYYKKAKILLLPSYMEGFAMVILEAMAWGCIPIVFDTSPAFHDLITDASSGFIINDMDKSEYERTCRKLMNDDKLRLTMAKNALLKSSDFAPDKIKELWLQLFEELTNI